MVIDSIVGLIKKTLYKLIQSFPKPFRTFGRNINVKVDLSNYPTKFKNATEVDTSKLAAKSDLASLKTEVDKIGVEKLETVPLDLSNLSNIVNNDVVKKTVFDKLVIKIDNIDTSRFVLKTKYTADKSDLEKKISDTGNKLLDTSGLVKKTDFSANITEIESKIPNISSLATNSALTSVENKRPDVINLVKKTNYDAKISDIEVKYITTADYNKFTKNVVSNNIKSKELVNKSGVVGFINNAELDGKVTALETKVEFKAEQNKIIKLQAFESSYFRGKNHFEDNYTQNCLIFQPMYR